MPTPAKHIGSTLDLSPGSRVYVRWGLDLVPAIVSDTYETSSGRRVVTLLDSHDSESGSPHTITLPEEDVFSSDDAAALAPPGGWVPRASYERHVVNALRKFTKAIAGEFPSAFMREGSDHGVDFFVSNSRTTMMAVQVKYSHKGQLSSKYAQQIIRRFTNFPTAAKLVVSNAIFSRAASEQLSSHHIIPLVWREEEGESALQRSFKVAFSDVRPLLVAEQQGVRQDDLLDFSRVYLRMKPSFKHKYSRKDVVGTQVRFNFSGSAVGTGVVVDWIDEDNGDVTLIAVEQPTQG